MGADNKGPLAYIVEKSKYKSLFVSALLMCVSFIFLYGAFSSERNEHQHQTQQLFSLEEHQRLEKQSAELKLMQANQLLWRHLQENVEQSKDMNQLYMSVRSIQQRGVQKLELTMSDEATRNRVLAAYREVMAELNSLIEAHDQIARGKSEKAQKLLSNLHKDTVRELEHEAHEDIMDSQILAAAKHRRVSVEQQDQQVEAQTSVAWNHMINYVKAKAEKMALSNDYDIPAQLSTWQALLRSLEEGTMSSSQRRKLPTMLDALPASLLRSNPVQALLQSSAMPQTFIVMHMRTLIGELQAHTHKAQILQIVEQWEEGNTTDHQAYLSLEAMENKGYLSRWLANAAEVQQDWQRDNAEAPRAPTPVPVSIHQQQDERASL